MNSLATRYASALLEIACDEGKNAEYRAYIKDIYKAIENDNSLSELLDCVNITKVEKKQMIDKIFADSPFESIRSFFKVIVDNSRGHYIKDILKEFISLSNAKDNISEGYIYVTNHLSEEEINRISTSISNRIKRKVYLVEKVDESLIGGFKVVIDDYVFDASIKNKLEGLKQNLLERGQ